MPAPDDKGGRGSQEQRDARKAERDKRKAERKAAGLPPDPADEVDEEEGDPNAPRPDQTLPGDLPPKPTQLPS